MKKYAKPAISVMNLQLKENIADVSTTVMKGTARTASQSALVKMALTSEGTGLAQRDGLVAVS